MNSDDDLAALLKVLAEQEQRLVFSRFEHADAWALGSSLVLIAQARELPVAVDIRVGGQQVFHAAMPGTTPENDSWIERKVRTVERFHASSYLVGRRLAGKNTALDEELGVDPMAYAAHGGSFPIRVAGAGVIGAVTVSGLPQADDHALVVEAIETFLQG